MWRNGNKNPPIQLLCRALPCPEVHLQASTCRPAPGLTEEAMHRGRRSCQVSATVPPGPRSLGAILSTSLCSRPAVHLRQRRERREDEEELPSLRLLFEEVKSATRLT